MADVLDDANTQDNEEDFIFNEYAIDDSLDPLSRLINYHQSDFSLQRLVLVQDLCDTVEYAGFEESVKNILPVIQTFTSDAEPLVRQTLVQQLCPLAKYFVEHGGEEGYSYVPRTFLPVCFELLVDKNVEVGSAALQAVTEVANLVHDSDIQECLVTVVISLAHDERAEDYRVVAAQLFNDLAPKFGPAICADTCLGELVLLSNDSSFSVRKTVAARLGGITKVLHDNNSLLSVVEMYVCMCADDTWGVRVACAEGTEEICLGLPEQLRVQQILPAFQTLLDDGSRWVRNKAHECLGRVIHTLQSKDISQHLVELYTNMAFIPSDNGEAELSGSCAFCFPAVVQALGKERWEEIQDAYSTMLRDTQWKVRRSLAYSLHELAEMLGVERTEHSLVPAFEILLRDLDDIKIGVVLNVDRFLSVVRPKTLETLVPLLCHVPLESENWRLRNEVAKRIGRVAVLLSPSSPAFQSVVALVLRLFDDSVMEVRASTYRPAAMILKHLHEAGAAKLPKHGSSGDSPMDSYLQTIMQLADRPTFQGRQMFAYVAQQAVEVGADDLVETYLLDGLCRVADDRVRNVRLVIERVMVETFLKSSRWKEHLRIQQIMETMEKKNKLEDLRREMVLLESRTAAATNGVAAVSLQCTDYGAGI